MMNPTYHTNRMRTLINEYEPSRERSLAITKLDECELWLSKCTPTQETLNRDQAAPSPITKPFADLIDPAEPIGADAEPGELGPIFADNEPQEHEL